MTFTKYCRVINMLLPFVVGIGYGFAGNPHATFWALMCCYWSVGFNLHFWDCE